MLPEYFKVDYNKSVSNPNATFTGHKYRITVLSEMLLRLEYDANGAFENRPTELAICRDFKVPDFQVKQDNNIIIIETKYFKLEYHKEKPFVGSKIAPDANLRVTLLNSDRVWYYNHPEVRNFKGTAISLDDNKMELKKGLYSTDGFVSIDDSTSLIFEKDGTFVKGNQKRIDLYLFTYRKDFGLCLKDYFTLTGFPPLIPRYALGIWWYKNERYNEDDIKELVNKFNHYKIPISVILLGHYWHEQKLVNKKLVKSGYSFNPKLFPNPKEFINYLHERAIHLGVNINPINGVLPTEPNYMSFAKDINVDKNIIVPLNVYDKNFINSYFNNLIRPLTESKIDFFWIDYFKGGNLQTLRALNHYHFNYYKQYETQRGMILSRNGLIAPHRYPIHYSGETYVSWETLKSLPAFNASASNIGVSWWSHDIGGYKNGTEDEELYRRFVQLGVYSPIFRFAAEEGRYYKREPWKWEIKTLNIVQDYCILRQRLIPYIYNEGYKYHKTGLPLVQPLYYTYPKIFDEPIYKNEYFFGSELFISPITTPKDTVMNRAMERIFLPNGTWYDFKTGKKFPGGKRYVAFYKDEDYPVFAKSGSIIPLAILEKNRNVTNPPKEMEIHIFPGKSNTYNLYEDDGFSSLYESGYYITTQIDYNYQANNYTVIIRPIDGKTGIIPDERNYKIRFRNTKQADDVIVYLGSEQIEVNSYVDDTDFIVEILNVPTTKQLSINCKGKDIEIDAVRLINEDIESIINDAKIKTELKGKIANIIFSELDIRKKRIQIRKLKKLGLENMFVKMFIRLLEYVAEF